MSGIIGHLAKRGYEAATGANADMRLRLEQEESSYDAPNPIMELSASEALPVVITFVTMFVLLVLIGYTVGHVMGSLTMIESRTATAIIEDKPPAYADGAEAPDAPIEKDSLLPSEAEADVEVTLINTQPITSGIRATSKHLTRIGGVRAHWRGFGVYMVYLAQHSVVSSVLAALLGLGFVGEFLTYIVASVALARLHMVWTHSTIAHSSALPFYRRFVKRENCMPILLPSLVLALAEQATVFLPLFVARAVGLPERNNADFNDCGKLAWMAVGLLAVPATMCFVAFALLLPAVVTLTRIEALLLPEDQDTLVPFDRQALIGDIDITAKGSSKALFVQAWRSFDNAARWRLAKLYAKNIAMQFGVVIVGFVLLVTELYYAGPKLREVIEGDTVQM